MSLYYLRHGLTDWNAKNVMQGRIDIPLNDEGKEEARKAKAEVDAIPLSLAVVSPLTRTRETAAILLEGRDVEIVYDERILEQYFGNNAVLILIGRSIYHYAHGPCRHPLGRVTGNAKLRVLGNDIIVVCAV